MIEIKFYFGGGCKNLRDLIEFIVWCSSYELFQFDWNYFDVKFFWYFHDDALQEEVHDFEL